MTFTLDSLHPDRLRCDHCGQFFGPVDTAAEDPEALVDLTEDQVAHRWPHLAADVALHDYTCPALPGPTFEECEGWPAPR
jgi:hypothetical protein